MNIRKLIAIVLAVLINCAVLGWFHTWSTAVVANAAQSHTNQVLTLPTITVRPSRAQIQLLRGEYRPPATSSIAPAGDGGIQTLVMPFYSFGQADATESV